MKRKYFDELNGLRAISVLLVFTVHLEPNFWHRLHGGTGVSIFFVLSGYLITTLALREETKAGKIDLKAFYLRRLFRIYPVYFAVLAAYCILLLVVGLQADKREVFLDNLPFYLFFFPERPIMLFGQATEVPFSIAWSLGIEEKFYLFWPLLGFVILSRRFRARMLFLVFFVVAFTVTAVLGDVSIILQPYALIALGCIIAMLLNHPSWYNRLKILGHSRILLATTLILATLQVSTNQILPQGSLYIPFGLLVAVMLTGVVTTTSPSVAWLGSRPMMFLGQISYAFYLTHGFAINAVELALPSGGPVLAGLTAAAALGVAILTAWLMRLIVEEPMIKIGKTYLGRRSAAVARPTSGFGV
ncbi:UNVERIFIED_CONTAM: acyltransferase [Kocuria sp. CPCC 205316]|uniref:acyltransferase family protein n=1 Tax=Kocuria TaxID=57493 RepID=UPI0036DAD155